MSTIKKKRVSKKSKLSWRKHVNINDIDEFLEDQRLEERLGPPLATLTNDELFTVNTKPYVDTVTSRERKRLKLTQPPKCFAILRPHTNVPDPIKKRNRVRTPWERKNELIKKKEAANHSKGIFKHKELQALHDRKVNEKRSQCKPKKGEFNHNIWSDESELVEKNCWFESNTTKHNLVGTGNIRKVIRNPVKSKTSILPSIELPHPGMSYNPSYDDHQDLLKIVVEKELEVIKQENHLNRVTKNMFSKVTVEKRDSSWLEEMSEGLSQSTTQVERDNDDGDYKAINPPTKNMKKTLKQRRKQKEQSELTLQRKSKRLEKRKITDLHQLKMLKEQIKENDIKSEKLREKRKTMQLLKKKEPKRLGLIKFEEADFEFNMGADISGNLRGMKTEGSLLTDRFKSLQRRNIIAPSTKTSAKKGKVKVYTKSGHRDDWMKTVAR